MAVVSHSGAAALVKEAIVLDLGDLARQGQQIVAAAETQAQEIVARAQQQARQDAVAIQERARAQGHGEGLAQGLEEGRQRGHAEALGEAQERLAQIERAWSDLATQWQAAHQDLERQARQNVLELSLALAEKLVHRVIEVDGSVIVAQLDAALAHVLGPMDVLVHICPDDRPVLEEALPRLVAEFGRLKSIRLKDDAAVARGGCELHFGQGAVDARVQTQLRRAVELLLPTDAKLNAAGDVGARATADPTATAAPSMDGLTSGGGAASGRESGGEKPDANEATGTDSNSCADPQA